MKPHRIGWRDFLIEGALLAGFMISASAFTILLEHPRGLLSAMVTAPLWRRALEGLAMGLTAIVLIYSPWGKRTGAHMNPAVTLTLSRLKPMPTPIVAGYVAGQFCGGVAGIAVAAVLFGPALSHASVGWVVTRPGAGGATVALVAEFLMTLLLMTVVLRCSNHPRLASRTGIASAALVAAYITVEAPLSGMSLNPARTLGPALFAHDFTALWVYFVGPPAGMALALVLHRRRCPGLRCPHGFHGAQHD